MKNNKKVIQNIILLTLEKVFHLLKISKIYVNIINKEAGIILTKKYLHE